MRGRLSVREPDNAVEGAARARKYVYILPKPPNQMTYI